MPLIVYVVILFCKHQFFPQGAENKVCNSKWQHFVRTVISSVNFDFIPDHVDLTNLQSLGYFKFLYGRSITTKNHQNKLNWMLFWLNILINFVKVMSCPNQHLIIRDWFCVVVCYRFWRQWKFPKFVKNRSRIFLAFYLF